MAASNMNKLRRHCAAMWQKRRDDETLLLSNLPTAEYVPAPAYLKAYCAELGLFPSEEHSFYQLIARICAQLDDEGKSLKITTEGCWQFDPDSGKHVWIGSWYGRNSYHVSDLLRHTWPLLNKIQAKSSARRVRRQRKDKYPHAA